jgi:hypothetical protein
VEFKSEVPLPRSKCGDLGQFAGDEDSFPRHRVRAQLRCVGPGNANYDRRSLGIRAVSRCYSCSATAEAITAIGLGDQGEESESVGVILIILVLLYLFGGLRLPR